MERIRQEIILYLTLNGSSASNNLKASIGDVLSHSHKK